MRLLSFNVMQNQPQNERNSSLLVCRIHEIGSSNTGGAKY